MKPLFVLIILLTISFGAMAQYQYTPQPKYFINSKEYSPDKVYINPNNIESLNIKTKKEDGKKVYEHGEVHMKSKKRRLKFITLKNLLSQHTQIKKIDSTLLFRINNEYITDIEGIKIDDSYYKYVYVENIISKAQYIEQRFKDLRIINIYLETEERKPQTKIMIR